MMFRRARLPFAIAVVFLPVCLVASMAEKGWLWIPAWAVELGLQMVDLIGQYS